MEDIDHMMKSITTYYEFINIKLIDTLEYTKLFFDEDLKKEIY